MKKEREEKNKEEKGYYPMKLKLGNDIPNSYVHPVNNSHRYFYFLVFFGLVLLLFFGVMIIGSINAKGERNSGIGYVVSEIKDFGRGIFSKITGNSITGNSIFSFFDFGTSSSEIIPSYRRINWSAAGIPGGILDVTYVCANVRNFNASGSSQTTLGNISLGSNQLSVSSIIDFSVGQGIIVAGAGYHETVLLNITTNAIYSSVVNISLDGIRTSVSVNNGDSASAVADKIRATSFNGWTVGGLAGSTSIIFIANTIGNKMDANYYPLASGANGTIKTILQGSIDLVSKINSITGNIITISNFSNETISNTIISHDDSWAIQNAINNCSDNGVVYIPEGTYML